MRLLLLVASLLMGAPKGGYEAAIGKVLDAAQEKVSECVLASAPDGLWTLTVHAEISINGSGQLIACRAVLDPERKGAASTSECVEQVLRAATYPKTGAGLVTISRVWTFSMQE